jgi:mannose-6-phosphate isomerase-like protein (cupin superfamily)
MEIINRNSVQAFITKDNSEIREIMAPANSSVERQSLAEAVVYPRDCTFPHVHKTTEEIYYILQGQGVIWLEEEQCEVNALDAIAILPGTKHKIKCTGDKPLVFLCMCVPHYTDDDTVLIEEQPD